MGLSSALALTYSNFPEQPRRWVLNPARVNEGNKIIKLAAVLAADVNLFKLSNVSPIY